MKTSLILALVLLSGSVSFAQSQPQLPLMPWPASVQQGSGQLPITQGFSATTAGTRDASLDQGVQRFLTQLSRQTGMRLVPQKAAAPTLTLQVNGKREPVQKLGEDESYELTVTASDAKLTAATPLGALRGFETFLQLIHPTPSGFAVPAVTIKDQPRFPWRGLLIDVSRHFMPIDALKRNVDGMAAVKMNVLHLHLSDDQGFRMESKKFPKLQEMGSEGMFYTQAEMRDFINYAYERGIRVVPEFDIPGHSRSWLPGYPELSSTSGPFQLDPNGTDTVMDPTREETYKFFDKFIEEMSRVFPDAYFHIGGDEVDPKPWNSNPKIQEFIRAHGMKNNQDLQAYFNQRLQKILAKHHKMMVGWDEILHPDLPKSIVIQSWRGQESLAAAAKQGYSGLLSHGYYLDLMWPASRHYEVDPMSGGAANLSPEEKARILGGEACMWDEWVTPELLDSRLWPRAAAIAERFWSPQEVTDVKSMYARLDSVSAWLEWFGLTHLSVKNPMLRRQTGAEDVTALRTLADVLEPIKDYERKETLNPRYDFRAPRNRIVDAITPESLVARQFNDLVQSYLQSNGANHAAEAAIRDYLTRWEDNDIKLHPMLEQSFLLQEVEPLSQDLSALSAVGLRALDYLDRSAAPPEEWKTQQLALTENAKTPRANLLLMVADPIQQLIEAAGKQATSGVAVQGK
ncbi:MAG TPA: beta-N-acetylhexosaminidase [Candidatus Sulfotelmatobacter sp.]|nr:beta-N-acetylhexosaminidase [Candidatus Sulfotelmatobacter sp.]